jgi:hypothetical protein
MLGAALVALAACSPPPAPLKEYTYPAWGFAVSFPAAPKVTDVPASADGAQPHHLQIETPLPGYDFLVSVADGSASTKTDDEVLNQVPDVVAKSAGGTVTSQTYVATGKVVGRDVLIDKPGQATLRMRVYVSNKNLYQVAAQSARGPKDPQVEAFLDSFRLLGK